MGPVAALNSPPALPLLPEDGWMRRDGVVGGKGWLGGCREAPGWWILFNASYGPFAGPGDFLCSPNIVKSGRYAPV
jgi:hypothetical protein